MNRRSAIGVRHLGLVVLALGLSLSAAAPAAAQTTVVLDAPDSEVTDTSVRGGSYARTNMDRKALATRASEEPAYERRALIKFDTHNFVPANATIQSATLTLTVKGGNDETRRIAVYRVAQSFDEKLATWRGRERGRIWRTDGGELGDKYAEASVTGTPRSKVTFDVTALVRATVKGDFGSRYTRVALLDRGRESRGSYREYYDSEASDPSVRPRLVVVYGGKAPVRPAPVVTKPAPVPPKPAPVVTKPAPVPPKPAPVVTKPAPVPPARDTSGSSTLKVLHWNVHHGGVGTDGRYDPRRIATWITRFNPDIVSLNEVDDRDQLDAIVAALRAKSGVAWSMSFAGRGNALLTRLRLDSKSTCTYNASYPRNAAHLSTVVNGRRINVWSVHLAVDSGSTRVREVKALQNCAESWAEGRIVAGDFNAQASSSEIALMARAYNDEWAKAARAGTAVDYRGNSRFGATRNSRIDYVFSSQGATWLKMKSAQVFDTRDGNGKMPSDHKPLLVTYEVK